MTASFAYNGIGCRQLATWPDSVGLGWFVGSGPSLRSVRETDVVLPSNTLAIGDAVPWNGSGSALPYCFSWDSCDWYPIGALNDCSAGLVGPPTNALNVRARIGIQKRHGGRWNVLFCDQHIENLTTKALFDVSQDSIAQRWNIDQLPHNR